MKLKKNLYHYCYYITPIQNSNLVIEKIINNFRFRIEENILKILTTIPNEILENSDIDVFEYSADKLCYLYDIITFCTDLPISSRFEYCVFTLNNKINIYDLNSNFENLLNELIKKSVKRESGSFVNGGDLLKVVDKNQKNNFNKEKLDLIDNLLDWFRKTKAKRSIRKLLNYWRKGFDLEIVTLWNESFLSLYKILEYFEKNFNKNNVTDNLIKKLNQTNSKAEKKSIKIILAAGFKKIKQSHINLIKNIITIRNNFDIAHVRIYPLSADKNERLYYTYYHQYWDIHDHLKEITRLIIIKKLGFRNFYLKNEGGLLSLKSK